MFFESHFKLEADYGRPFAAFPKPGSDSYLVWYSDERSNVFVLEVWSRGGDEVQSPKPVLAIEQPRETARRTK